ncbi:MAG TPA: hypothetical protein PKW90_25945, partial [Myxococcota bacterium]|nr:hypothetical protein [Myxococcota bacterium]
MQAGLGCALGLPSGRVIIFMTFNYLPDYNRGRPSVSNPECTGRASCFSNPEGAPMSSPAQPTVLPIRLRFADGYQLQASAS